MWLDHNIIGFTCGTTMLILNLPPHISPLGSGSHSPFPVHIVELGPVSTSPGGQLNLTVLPSIGKPLSSKTFGTDLESPPQVDDNSGRPQLATYYRAKCNMFMISDTTIRLTIFQPDGNSDIISIRSNSFNTEIVLSVV